MSRLADMIVFINYSKLPERLQNGARLWIEHGVDPGDFLQAVIRNDLTEAFSRADCDNMYAMPEIVKWWYNEAPSPCWGSVAKHDAWKKMHEEERKSAGKSVECIHCGEITSSATHVCPPTRT